MSIQKGVTPQGGDIGEGDKEAADTLVKFFGTDVTQQITRGNPTMNISKKIKGLAISCAALFAVCFLSSVSVAEEVGYKGANHDGVFLRATKTPAADAGIVVTLELECRKNWGGSSTGAAFVQVIGVEASEYKELNMSCKANGGADGATKSNKATTGLFLKGSQTAVIVGSLGHTSLSNTAQWQKDFENTVKGTINNVVRSATDPRAILAAASGAGLLGTILK